MHRQWYVSFSTSVA